MFFALLAVLTVVAAAASAGSVAPEDSQGSWEENVRPAGKESVALPSFHAEVEKIRSAIAAF